MDAKVRPKHFLWAAAALAAMIGWAVYISPTSGGSSGAVTVEATAPTPKHPEVSDIVSVVGSSESGRATVFPSHDDYRECRKFALAKDGHGAAEISNARAMIVTGAPDARVIERESSGVRIRLMGGEFAGRDGWTFPEFVAAK